MATPKALRLQALCTGCNSNIDIVVHPLRGAEALDAMKAHLRAVHVPSCYQEESHGQDEGSPGAGEARPGEPAAPGTGNEGPEGRAH